MEKSGAAHIEMIISFLFFVTFVFFLFVILKPYDTQILTGAVVNGMFDSFEENTRTNLTTIFLKANHSAENPPNPSDCLSVQLPSEIFVYSLNNSIVTSVGAFAAKIDSEIDSGTGDLNIDDTSDVFYKVSISPEFDDDSVSSCDNIPNYELGSVIERNIVSYSFLENMGNDYLNNYSNLRASLRIPESFDFAIVSDNLPLDMEREIPNTLEVVAKEYVMEVLYANGTIINTKFILKVW